MVTWGGGGGGGGGGEGRGEEKDRWFEANITF